MKRSPVLFVALSSMFSLFACGESVCEHYQRTVAEIRKQALACNTYIELSTFKGCMTATVPGGSCTAADQIAINRQFDCIDRVKACVPGKADDWYNAVRDCSAAIDNVSTSCRAALTQ